MNNSEGQTQEPVNNWPDEVRLKMIEKSEFYQDPKIYQYGFYDGYQLANYTPPPAPIKTEGERLGVKDVFASDKDIINAGYITDELLPCPFCGNKTVLTYGNKNEKTGNITYFVTCNRMSGCGANIFTCLGGEETADNARQEMVDTWNNRKVSVPPSPVGIEVEDLLDKLKYLDHVLSDEGFESESEVRKIVTQTINYVTEAGYAATLPQSSTGGLPKLDQPILDDEDVKGIIESSTEEEKDLWKTALNFFQGEYILKPFTTKEEVISELLSTYKIFKR